MHRDDQAILYALFPTLAEKIEESRERRREQARRAGVSVTTYQVVRDDRWFPGTRTTEFPGIQVVGADRAWLPGSG